jgi:hypothetical protein
VQLLGGTADAGDSTSLTCATFATNYPSDDTFNGQVVEVVNGTGRGSNAVVTNYTGSTGVFSVAAWLKADGSAGGVSPGEDSEFSVKPVSPYYHPAGFAYDSVIEAACLAACEIYGGDTVFDTHHSDLFFKVKLPLAHQIDGRMIPRRLGTMTDGPAQVRERTWKDVMTRHDVP